MVTTVAQRVIPALERYNSELGAAVRRAWGRLTDDPALRQAFVLKADFFRVAVVFLEGGWWLDADVRCIDPIVAALDREPIRDAITAAATRANLAPPRIEEAAAGCVWAWEGETAERALGRIDQSSPLNWAFGCAAEHPFLAAVLEEMAAQINAYDYRRTAASRSPEFTARVRHPNAPDGWLHIDVLSMTGPALVERALRQYTGLDLLQIRVNRTGESPMDRGTWDRATLFDPPDRQAAAASRVLVLPYCFFRSRGCGHLNARFDDRVIFHHEFETAWRPSFWHNYADPNPTTSSMLENPGTGDARQDL